MSYAHFCRDFVILSLFMMLRAEEREINCGSHFTSRAGTVISPNYPDNYPPNSFCVWTITVSGKDPQIKLKFSSFDLPGKVNGKCSDYVSVYYGQYATQSKLLNTYCGTTVPTSQVVKAESVRVEFLSDGSGSDKGFFLSFTASVTSNAITTSQATAGIVAAIFCGIVFIGVATMRCIMMGACQNCHIAPQQNQNRECVGTNETLSNYVMDCPPSYRTVMEHPESFPTPNITPCQTPTSTPGLSEDEDEDGEPPPPYSQIVPTAATTSGITAHDVAEHLMSGRHNRNVITVDTHHNEDSSPMLSQRHSNRRIGHREAGNWGRRMSNQSDSNESNNSIDSSGINNQNNRNGTADHRVDIEINNRTTNQGDSNGTTDQIGNIEINNRTTNQRDVNGTTDQTGNIEINNRTTNQRDVNGISNRDASNDTTRRSDVNGITDHNNINGITHRSDHASKPESLGDTIHNYVEIRL